MKIQKCIMTTSKCDCGGKLFPEYGYSMQIDNKYCTNSMTDMFLYLGSFDRCEKCYKVYNFIEDREGLQMNFNEYQQKASTTAIYLNKVKERFPELPSEVVKILGISYVANGLGEVGEVQGKVKKLIRDCGGEITQDKINELSKEIGDILWYIAAMCSELGINMQDVAEENIEKLFGRKERGVLMGSGDNR